MLRSLAGLLSGVVLLIGSAASARSEVARADPWFDRLPFGAWLSQGERTDLPWSADVLPAENSPHQRLMLRIVIRLYGSELEKRRGPGQFITLVQYTDRAGRVWQHHTSMDLANLSTGIGLRQIAIAQYAYVLPGDYSVAIAVCDTATLEHGLLLRQVHVAPVPNDPLPEAWAGLPTVAFIPPITEPPDVWYLPGVEGRLNLPLVTRRRIRVHLLVNITPSTYQAGLVTAVERNMNSVVPVLKTFSQISLVNGSMETALLDLTRLRVAFEQSGGGNLDWDGMRRVFLDARPGVVDAHSLGKRQKMAAFFRSEVVQRVLTDATGEPDAATPVVIVLSGPAFLDEQVAESLATLPAGLDYRLIYIRYHGVPAPAEDDLQHALDGLHTRIYDVASNQRVREILASVLDNLSAL